MPIVNQLMQNKFVSINEQQPDYNQALTAYKLKVVLVKLVFTSENRIQVFMLIVDF